MARIFKVQINLDDMCAELDTLRPDQHAEWLAGFRAGCRGKIPDGWDGPRLCGATFGLSCYQQAADFHAAQAERGRKSADARRSATGSAQPTGHQPRIERRSNGARTVLEPLRPEPDSELSSIQYPVSNIEKRVSTQPPGGVVDVNPDAWEEDPAAVCAPQPAPQTVKPTVSLMDWKAHGHGRCAITQGNREDWDAMWRRWKIHEGWEDAWQMAYDRVQAETVWPSMFQTQLDKLEKYITE